jgi:hypothetical protein|nr:MAG: hypothetical protein DIU61_16430 [Bacteroidota bacterium]
MDSVSVRVNVSVRVGGKAELVEEKTYYKVEDDEEDEHAIHYQVYSDIRPVLPIQFFQSFDHIQNSLPESSNSFFGLKRIVEATFRHQTSSYGRSRFLSCGTDNVMII